MPLTRRSKVKDVWRHPVGHDLLQHLRQRLGKKDGWLENPLVANLSLQAFERLAGPGFCDLVLEMCAGEAAYTHTQPAQQPAWWKEAVFYHIFVPSFMDADHDGVGDLQGVAQRLPYLSRLGVDVLWLWPLLPQDAHGTTDYDSLALDETLDDLEALLTQAHSRNMWVVMGVDIAATSHKHSWFTNTNAQDGVYVLRQGSPGAPPNNWAGNGASLWSWYTSLSAWGLHLGGPHKVDLNWDSAGVRQKMAAVLNRWAETGIDGFFFGPVQRLSKNSYENGSGAGGVNGMLGYEKYTHGPRLHRYLQELRAALPKGLLLGGELSGAGPQMAKLYTAEERRELDLVLDDSPLLPRAAKQGDEEQLTLPDLKKYYLEWMTQYGDNWMALFLENSQLPRMVSRLGASPLYRAILAKLLATLLLTLRGTPIIYQGQELGVPNTRFAGMDELRDPRAAPLYAECCKTQDATAAFQQVVARTADHARTPMPWAAGPKAGFTGAVPWMRLPDGVDFLNAATQMEDANSVWRYYQRLLEIRRANPCLVYGGFHPVFAKNKRVFCYFRILDGVKWYVEMNLTERQVSRPGRILRSQKLVLSNYDLPAKALRPYEANLYRCE